MRRSRRGKAFKDYPIGYFHIDIAELRTEDGKLYMIVAIDRVTEFAFAELHDKATRQIAAECLERLIAFVPHTIEILLTDNGTHVTTPGKRHPAAADFDTAKSGA